MVPLPLTSIGTTSIPGSFFPLAASNTKRVLLYPIPFMSFYGIRYTWVARNANTLQVFLLFAKKEAQESAAPAASALV